LQIQDMNDAASMAGKESEVIEKARRHGAGENLEIVSSPKAADQPATHFRLAVTLAGALLGILLGGVLSRGKTRHGSAQRVMPAALRAVNP